MSTLTSETAIRIAAAMAAEIVDALRPACGRPIDRNAILIAIGRAAGVRLPEIDEADAQDRQWIGQIKSELCLGMQASRQAHPVEGA